MINRHKFFHPLNQTNFLLNREFRHNSLQFHSIPVSYTHLHSTSFPIIYAAHTTGIAANQPEKKEKIKPIYRFFLKLPHQSIILFTVLNMIFHLLSGFQLPSALLPHGPATFADKADCSESTLPDVYKRQNVENVIPLLRLQSGWHIT